MPKAKSAARPTHNDYLYVLSYIVSVLLSSADPDSRQVRLAVDHLKGWRVCRGCKDEARNRQFPQGEFDILHFREEQLSPPERARRQLPLDFLGHYIEAKHRRK